MLLSGCDTLQKTATTANISIQAHNATVADLKVGERISYTMTPSDEVRRGGEANVKQVAEAEALEKKGGNADLLVNPLYVISKKRGLFSSKITSITVSGRPAFYTNFRPLPDSVFSNPVYRGIKANRKYSVGKPATKDATPTVAGNKRTLRKKGFSMQFELTPGATFTEARDESHYDKYLSTGLLLNPTYNLNSRWAVGIGFGFNSCLGSDGERWSVPLYLQARHYFSPTVKSWFADVRLGANISCYEETPSGANVGVGIGYSFKYFELAARYNYRGSIYTEGYYDGYWDEWRYPPSSRYGHQVSLALAWKF